MLMQYGDSQGWCYAEGEQIEELKKNGWSESSEEERAKIIEKKRNKIEKKEVVNAIDVVIIKDDGKPKGKPGRKPKNLADSSGDGNSSDNN